MKDTIELLRDLSNANKTIFKQKQVIEKMQAEIDRLRCQTKGKDIEIKHLAIENEKLEDALADNKIGANLLIKQIVDDIVKSGFVKLEVEE